MITRDNCILLGTLTKPHATKGSLLLRIIDLKADDIKERGSVFVEIDGLLVPFFIEDFQVKSSDTVVLKIEGVNSETKAREFAGLAVYLNKDQVRRKSKGFKRLPGIQGYRVTDRKLGYIGLAMGTIDVANNPLLVVRNGEKEFLVPAHEDLILEINDKDKVIRIDAPEGLFDL